MASEASPESCEERMTDTPVYAVAIVVDPEFGDRLIVLLDRMPVWIAESEANRAAVARARAPRSQSGRNVSHTAIGALTTFKIDTDAAPGSWCLGILDTVAGHNDRYSHSPGYSALEIYGAEPSPELLTALAEYRLTKITAFPDGFRASTSDGQPAGSPNDP
jgi:hypothetical protein